MFSTSRRSALPLALLVAGALTATACGSALTEQEVLARSATAVSQSNADAPDTSSVTSTTTVNTPDTPAATSTTTGDAAAGANQSAPAASPGEPTGGTSGHDTAEDGGGEQAGTACATQETGPIVIATVGNYSGAGGSAQGGFPPAIQAWAAYTNSRGGLCGREVNVIVQDDGGDQARYASLVRDSVENRGAIAFVGNGAVLSGSGGLAYHEQSGVPVIGNDCTNKHWFDSGVLFPTCPTPYDQTASFLINGVQLFGTNKFGYVYCTEAQACLDVRVNLHGGGLQDAGVELMYEDTISIAQIDFTAECQAARNAGAELFFVAADPATVGRMVQSCSRQNYFPHYLCGSVSCGPSAFAVRGFEDAAVGNPVFPFVAGSGGAIDEYNHVRETFAPDVTPSASFSIGWASAKLFELAATRAAQTTGSITPQTLIDALFGLQDETLDGLTIPMNFGPDGANNGNCYFSMQGDGSGGFVIPNGSAAICR